MTRRPVAVTRRAVLECLAGRGQFSLLEAKGKVNELLNGGTYDRFDFGTEDQVARVLNQAVARGELRKVSRGVTGPDGEVYRSRHPEFYTEAGWKQAEAKAAGKRRTAEAITARWARVYDELVSQGHRPVTERGRPVRISSASWFRLLGLDGG